MFFYCSHWIIIMVVKDYIKIMNWEFDNVQLLIILFLSEVLLLASLFKIIPQSIKSKLGV